MPTQTQALHLPYYLIKAIDSFSQLLEALTAALKASLPNLSQVLSWTMPEQKPLPKVMTACPSPPSLKSQTITRKRKQLRYQKLFIWL